MGSPFSAASLASWLARHPHGARYWVSFSGGLDSTVLLHLCHTLRDGNPQLAIAAAHVHHGLHAAADQWAAFCAATCARLGIPLEIRHVDARPTAGASPEEAARQARYRALAGLLGPGETLLTAHHQDDQAETLLLQLLRGAGLAGLAAMPEWTAFGHAFLARPLLAFRRQDLLAYAHRHQLEWLDDGSNAELRFDRNYLRHEIQPRLAQRWPQFAKNVSRSAHHCAEADALLGEFAHELLHELRHPVDNTLNVAALRRHSTARQRLILREWFRTSGCERPSSVVMERILQEVLLAARDRQPIVRWRAAQLRRFRGRLYLLKPFAESAAGRVIAWDGAAPLDLGPEQGTLRIHREAAPGIDPRCWQSGPISVRYRQGGETLRLPNRTGVRDLKKLLQEAGVEPWIRNRLPLLYIGDDLAAVADYWVTAPFAGSPGATNIQIIWGRPQLAHRRGPLVAGQ